MHWKEVLPSDKYIAYMDDRLHETDRDTVTLLYQPLIGALAYSLYMTLVSEVCRNDGKKVEQAHKALMIYTGKNLDEIFQERKKLEAIGLIKVYRQKVGDEFIHYYSIKAPMSPENFFKDDMLSVFLYNRIGSKEQYIKLRNSFRIDRLEEEGEYENITRSFDQVFTSLHPSEMSSNHPEVIDALTFSETLEGRPSHGENYGLMGLDFNYEAMLAFLPPFVPKQQLTLKKNEQLIRKLAFLYKIDANEMSKVIQDSFLHMDELDLMELRKQVKLRYRMKEVDKPPRLGLRVQSEELRTSNKEPMTEEEKQIHYYETTSPIEFMEELGDGAKVYPGDVDIVEQMMFDYKLEPGVVNVLLEYLFFMHDKKLIKNLAFKIASHWSRAKLKTVKEAMTFAKKEYEKNESVRQKQSQEPKNNGKSYSKSKSVKAEPLPKWMTDENWNKKSVNNNEWMEAKKKVEQYKEMLKKSKGEG
ncbi:DnaD domain protein [Evansella sp. AB-P1]|uniref:replication initiation and membrane attachment family protein n=1 Tax=Evansella sp. AB-P1 TaxID=3037653 RepID=UPI00241D3C55|nr:DnaD domain protein [Evansella sp. AB-P1]MDG5786960.1 DnaD domain protein [Evansella sp. AB-P1]